MQQISSFIIVLVPLHFSEGHLLRLTNYRVMPGVLCGFTVIKEMMVFFHRVVLTLNK